MSEPSAPPTTSTLASTPASTPKPPPAESTAEQPFSSAYRWYALILLVVVYIFNFIDRSILGILVEPIKQDLGVSDTAMGFLGGIAFAVFYTMLGIPIARLADSGSRRNVLAVCLALWSAATALCGFVQNFYQLLAARIGVAVGEAGGSPPSHSMISDMFPPDRRATALAIYALGIPIGTMLGNLGGGWVADSFSWRTAFLLVGAPGIVLALIVRLTLKEPPRGASEGLTFDADIPPPPVAAVFSQLWQKRSFRFMAIGASLHAFVGYGVSYWIPAMFNRTHGLSGKEMGFALFYLGFASIAGTFLGGYMGDKLGARDKRWYLWLPGIATALSLPFSYLVYTLDSPYTALWILSVPYVLGAYYLGPTFSLTQSMVGLRMRALASSILLFILNIIGLGLGPQFTGIASDVLAASTDLGQDSLRWALVISLIFNIASSVCYVIGARYLRDDLAAPNPA